MSNNDRHHAPLERRADFRFYEELNDFLPQERRKRTFVYVFQGTPAVKDVIEALGIPHTAVDLVLIDGESVDFGARLQGGERVAVYPPFERLDISALIPLRPEPLRDMRFILDTHLGTLARYLRLLGCDTVYRNDFRDETIVERANAEKRIVLTRDKGVLKRGRVTHGYFVRSTDPESQVREVVNALDLSGCIEPFTRCIACNGALHSVEKDAVLGAIPRGVAERHDAFSQCSNCRRVYWKGSHYDRMTQLVESVT